MVRAATRRQLGPWIRGPQDAIHPDTVELCLLLGGEMRTHVGGVPGRMRGGDVSVIPPGVVHSSWTEGESATELIIHLDAALVGPVRAGLWRSPSLRPGVFEAVVTARPDELLPSAFDLLTATQARGPVVLFEDPRLARAASAVCSDLARPWSVPTMARIAAMSVAHFARKFREASGQTPTDWLRDQRIERAAWLMLSSDRSLSEIALDVGLASGSRLTEAFRRARGVSPSAWRAAQGPR
jgi:AraC-like DNA-binding protein